MSLPPHTVAAPAGASAHDTSGSSAGLSGPLSGRQMHAAATAFVSLFSIVGVALYGLPFFYDFMVQEFGWTRQQVTSGNAYSKLIVGPLFGFFAGWLVDRFGPKRLMLVGITIAGLALVGLGSISTLGWFYFFYLLNALGYVCGGPLPNQVLLSRWFDRARGKAMGFAYIGIGLGGAIVAPLAHELTQRLGWHAALQALGILMIVLALPLALFLKDGPAGAPTAQTPAGATPTPAAPLVRVSHIFKHWTFPFLLIGSMCSIGAVGGTMQNLKLLLSLDKGIGQGEIAGVMSLILGGSIIGRLTMGWLADRFPRKYVMLLIYVIVSIAVPLVYWAPSMTTLHLAALLFGIGLGGDYMIIPLMAADLYGVRVLGRVMGVVLTADGVAEALAPMAVAAMRDSSGSYAGGFAVLVVLAVIGWLAVMALPARPTPLTSNR